VQAWQAVTTSRGSFQGIHSDGDSFTSSACRCKLGEASSVGNRALCPRRDRGAYDNAGACRF
jgi:hypothetical protein